MGLLDLKIEIARGKRWIGRNQRLEKLKAEQTKPKPIPPNSNSTTSSSSKGGKQQPASQYMDVELYNAATMDKDDVDAFIEVLERVAAKKRYAFEDIFQQVSPSGNTLLHLASSHQNEKIVRLIVHHCPSLILKQNKKGDTALHLAVRSHASGIAKIKARIREDWSVVIHTLLRFREDWLHPLASDEWIDAVRALPENVKLLRVRNEKGNTALHEALINQQEGAAFELIEGDPEVSYFLNAEGESPLYLAAEAGYKRLVSSMLSDHHDFEIRNKEDRLKGKSPLQAAMIRRDIDLMNVMLEKEPRFINNRDEQGRLPLHIAASLGYTEEVQYLLAKYPGGVVERDSSGLFPIHLAAIQGHIQVIEDIFKLCPYPRVLLNHNGQNILHLAVLNGKHEVIKYVERNSSLECLINQRDLDGNAPLQLFTTVNGETLNTLSQDKKTDLKIANNEGLTALNAAEYTKETPGPTKVKKHKQAFEPASTSHREAEDQHETVRSQLRIRMC